MQRIFQLVQVSSQLGLFHFTTFTTKYKPVCFGIGVLVNRDSLSPHSPVTLHCFDSHIPTHYWKYLSETINRLHKHLLRSLCRGGKEVRIKRGSDVPILFESQVGSFNVIYIAMSRFGIAPFVSGWFHSIDFIISLINELAHSPKSDPAAAPAA